MKKDLQAIVAVAASLAIAAPALAHHSFAMFDHSKEVELVGVVKEFQWTNPHIWIELVTEQNGKAVQYHIEGSSTSGLSRRGWTRSSFKPGDRVTMTINPLKNGEPGGSFVRATGGSGGTISDR